MLQRAASNAYSWWWASHIRKKQSTWLEQSLQDMEDKVKYTLKLLDEDGDSFAKRAEMYYKKRPELIEFVEDTHRAYRALADRYDHISGELQNANHTIATVLPEQFQYATDDDDEDNPPEKPACSHPNPGKLSKELPEVPSMPKFPQMSNKNDKDPKPLCTKKPRTKKTTTTTTSTSDSHKSNAKALEEIDKLQKEILGLQTEKEFVKSSYESGLAKYWEIEERITQMQEQVCSLQDEFNVGTVIEDDEARTLMATTALKSCKATLFQLQEKQEMLAKETTVENEKIKNAHEKLENLKGEFTISLNIQKKPSMKDGSTEAGKQTLTSVEHEASNSRQGRFELESEGGKFLVHFETNSGTSLTVIELAEKIDELVTKVTSMEAAMLSQTALVKRLRSETDELQANLQMEEEKANLVKGSNNLNNKLKELEKLLHGIQGLNKNVRDQNDQLQTDFAEARCSLDYLSKNLQCVKQPPNGEVQSMSSSQAHVKVPLNVDLREESVEQEGGHVRCIDPATRKDGITKKEEKGLSIPVEEVRVPQPNGHFDLDAHSEKSQQLKHQNAAQQQNTSKTENNALSVKLQELAIDEDDQPNWQSLFLNGLEDREKILLEKYTSILQKYKKAKNELSEVQKKNQDSLHETMTRVNELKGAYALKDKEIQSLQQEVNFLQTSRGANSATHSRVPEDLEKSRPHDEIKRSTSQSSNDCKTNSKQIQVPKMLEDGRVESTSRPDESSVTTPVEAFTEKEDIKLALVDEPHPLSTVEEKFRRDIDELLEENLEFWMRFSTSFQQIQKFQTAVQDLMAEYSKLKVNEGQHDGKTTATDQSQKSDARSIYKHLGEIQTELTVWLEQNALLKDELQDRFSSLGNIQKELSRVSRAGCTTEDANLVRYQAAKFQGEVLNMRQENNKVADELQAGLDHVKGIQSEIEKTLSMLSEDFKLSGPKSPQQDLNRSSSRNRVPLQSFIFGTKTKKQKPKIFLAMHPALHKQKLFHAHR